MAALGASIRCIHSGVWGVNVAPFLSLCSAGVLPTAKEGNLSLPPSVFSCLRHPPHAHVGKRKLFEHAT